MKIFSRMHGTCIHFLKGVRLSESLFALSGTEGLHGIPMTSGSSNRLTAQTALSPGSMNTFQYP